MRRTVLVLLLLTGPASAQAIVPSGDLVRVRGDFQRRPDEQTLRCDVTPTAPAIDFAFRVEAGYTFHVPQSQYAAPTEGWMVLTKVTPEAGEPTYLLAHTQFAKAPVSQGNFQIRGAYLLGVGRYSVEAILGDGHNRVCRQQWKVEVALSHADRAVPLALPTHAVRALAPITVPDVSHPDDAEAGRLTILLNAAPFSTHRTVIRERDRERTTDALTALLEHLPTTSVRLVVFSLEQQKEVFRADTFHPDEITKVAAAIAATPQATVDVGVLKNPFAYVDFLAGAIRRELDAPDPAETVIFLGPTSRYFEKGPKSALPAAGQSHIRFFYVRYEDFLRPTLDGGPIMRPGQGISPTWPSDPSHGMPDIIAEAVAQLNGKTLIVHSPAELADAIRKIEGKK